MYLLMHALPKLRHICYSVQYAARGQQVGVLCQLQFTCQSSITSLV